MESIGSLIFDISKDTLLKPGLNEPTRTPSIQLPTDGFFVPDRTMVDFFHKCGKFGRRYFFKKLFLVSRVPFG